MEDVRHLDGAELDGTARRRGRPAGTATKTQRLNVNVSTSAMAALHELAAANDVSITEITRRAIQLMRLVDHAMRDGKEVQVRDPETGQVQTLQFL